MHPEGWLTLVVVLPPNRDPAEGWDFSFTIKLKSLKELYDTRTKALLEGAEKKK